jgi:cobalt/nickel transport system permease protein
VENKGLLKKKGSRGDAEMQRENRRDKRNFGVFDAGGGAAIYAGGVAATATITPVVAAAALLLGADNAYAMHISEGILPPEWAALWFLAVSPFIYFGIRSLKKSAALDISLKPLVGLIAAVVFIISCMPIPVPTAGTCSHPCGTGLSAILLGPAISVLVSAAALLIQALFLAHGGISTWGANIMSMGVAGSFAGFLTFRALRALKVNLAISGFMAGMLADWATYIATSAELASGIRGDSGFMPLFGKIVIAFIPTQLPLGLLEGAMTAGMLVLLNRKRPDLLIRMRVLKPGEV